MKFSVILVSLLFTLNIAYAETRLCEKKKPFPAKAQMPHLSTADYEYEKHIYELSYDEIKDVTFTRYKKAIEYFDKELTEKIKKYGNLFNSSETAGNYRFHISAIHAYTLKQKALVETLTSGKGKATNEFCNYLSGLEYHP